MSHTSDSFVTVNIGRDELLTSAVATFAANPSSSMQDVAEAAGMSRATLHRRFASRDELVVAIARWALGQLAEITNTIAAEGRSGLSAIERLIEGGATMAPKLGFLGSEACLDGEPEVMARMEAIVSVWHAWIEDGQRSGEIRVDLPARWIADAIEGLMMAIFRGVRAGTTPPADALRLVRITLFDGIRGRNEASFRPSVEDHREG